MVRSVSKSANRYLVKEVAIGFESTIRLGELTADRSIRRGESYSGSRLVRSASKSASRYLPQAAKLRAGSRSSRPDPPRSDEFFGPRCHQDEIATWLGKSKRAGLLK